MSKPPRPTELLRLFVRQPRTARVILGFTVKTAFPAMKAFRRGDDEQAIQTFGYGFVGKERYERVPEARRQQLRENVNTLRPATRCRLPAAERRRRASCRDFDPAHAGERSPAFPLRPTDRLQQRRPLLLLP
jgi:hypothetical protein